MYITDYFGSVATDISARYGGMVDITQLGLNFRASKKIYYVSAHYYDIDEYYVIEFLDKDYKPMYVSPKNKENILQELAYEL